ncbi:MAG: cupin domain-containing protein [Spirosomaceae bacterium]|jgi:quercetin dioxygenase-like cupin family protein|nr:cupin domain-containing protein [Spirosomataceae bacterium]
MLLHNVPDLVPYEGVKTKKLEANEHFRVVLISLQKGERLDPHASPTDAFIYVLEGNANFNLEGEAIFLSPGDGLSFKAKQQHSVNALTDFKMMLFR